ncbi:hypothetical protein SS1G_13382 [Sclerotinia sclerotiorum 1980 UF-70]|uniref:Uncharacterized protein n=1 Tax=Sclerotinia sclerotiorum (strain ATCC 18683 / 1980 / Ss-1) TaxID=665079 RepID=A7F702_SCLS1|nr:hypothetical protein SS1G_13382 [Sclerotinia sclerotiorum 1980 UF-70]EDN98523.1 hypothetical protein SS1G_13382 [Sclerotinia sclerotiorum 1980 UF-70]
MNDLSEWCSACASISLFCEAILSNKSDPNNSKVLRSKGINGVVGGIIGAIVTLVVLILVALILALLGFRMQYREKKVAHSVGGIGILKKGSPTDIGGLKGPEKLASDTDLNIIHEPRVGATVKHERVGSWEMGNAPGSNSASLDKEPNRGQETVFCCSQVSRKWANQTDNLDHAKLTLI